MGADGVRLEPLAEGHAPAIQELASDPEIARTTNLPEPYPEDGARVFVRDSLAGRERADQFDFAVLADGRLVGVCGLRAIEDGGATIGYWIGRPFWSRGYATAAARGVVRFAFSELGLRTLHACCLEHHRASRRVLEKAGFRHAGSERDPGPKWGPGDRFASYLLERRRWVEGAGEAT